MQLTDMERELLTTIRESDNPKRALNFALIMVTIILAIRDNKPLYKALDELKEHEAEHRSFVKLIGDFALSGDLEGGKKAGIEFVENFAKGEAFVA